MKLKELINGVKVEKIIGNIDVDIKNVKIASGEVEKGSLFIAIKGRGFDGHEFIKTAKNYGAAAVVSEKECDISLPQIIVKDSRLSMSKIAGNFYKHPDKKLKLIGVTGTNGKTTTTHVIRNILENSGIKCGVIGTLGSVYGDKKIAPTLTTPDPLELMEILSDMVKDGIKVAVMEVSAHAIYLNKIEDMFFYVGIFTNLTRDHLDFFNDMENYKKTKLSFFSKSKCKFCVVNSDDETGREILKIRQDAVSYGLYNPADVFAVNLKEKREKTEYVLNLFDKIYDIKNSLIGEFNIYNSLAAATACSIVGVPLDKIFAALNTLSAVEGRLEKVYGEKFSVFVDYAHTPDGLLNSLKSLRKITEGKLICVFGCGGNRDKGKRSIMGKIASETADFLIITSDNPRYEDPMDIIHEIESGFSENFKNYVAIEDRSEGIEYALSFAKENDVVLIAGKGAENYQDMLGIKRLYNDKDTVNEIMRRIKE